MFIRKDSRQIPKVIQYTSSPLYSDILYSYLQEISYIDTDGKRYVKAADVSFVKIANELEMTRQTASKRFKSLQELGLIGEKEKGKFSLLIMERDLAALVPLDVLTVLVDTLKDNTISVYVYLMNRYLASGESGFDFTHDQLKKYLGLSLKTQSNNHITQSILYVLEQLGLIDCPLITVTNFDGTMTTVHHLNWLTNQLPKEKRDV